ncbi:MAG TPA: FkbM family methyltransferase [Steroidobacteraceae bacterium]|jgi:FkbM family methyltransferase|nr:FkbM family methyltransferase [Steroidobacteraceae bacterium]
MDKAGTAMDWDALLRTVDSRHGRISFFVNDTCAVRRSLELYGEWAENEIAFVGHFIPRGGTVLDVGAYIGTHTLAFARRVGSTGRVVAFEAQPFAFELLRRNIAANCLSNIEPRNAVVADSIGTVQISSIEIDRKGAFGSASVRSDLLPGEPGLRPGGQRETRRIVVPATTIDSLELTACALVKIDAEGTEDVVLRGARTTIARLQPVIYAECNSITDGLRCIEVLRSLNYEVRVHLADAFNRANFRDCAENIFGNAREAAVLGLPRAIADQAIPHRQGDLLVKVETADDLALALLNKPQYLSEILAAGAAARTGAAAWLEEMHRLGLSVRFPAFGRTITGSISRRIRSAIARIIRAGSRLIPR